MTRNFNLMLIAVAAGRVLLAIRQLLLVPVLISAWGTNYYGVWLVISTIPSFLMMSNLGIGTAANIKISHFYANNNKDEAGRVYIQSQFMIILMLIITVFIACVISKFWPSATENILEKPLLIVLALLVTLFLHMAATPLLGYWIGAGEPSKGYQFFNLNAFGALVVSIAVPTLHGKAEELSIVLLIWETVWLLIFMIWTFKRYGCPRSESVRAIFDLMSMVALVKAGSGHQLGALWQALLYQGSLLLAASFLGLTGAALWGALRTAARSGNQILEIISQSLIPDLQRSHANEDKSQLKSLLSSGLVYSISASLVMVLAMILIGPLVFPVWTHHSFDFPMVAWVILSMSVVPAAVWSVGAEVHRSANLPWIVNKIAIIMSIVAIIIMFFLQGYGVAGFAVAILVFEVGMAVILAPKTFKFIGLGFKEVVVVGKNIFRMGN